MFEGVKLEKHFSGAKGKRDWKESLSEAPFDLQDVNSEVFFFSAECYVQVQAKRILNFNEVDLKLYRPGLQA